MHTLLYEVKFMNSQFQSHPEHSRIHDKREESMNRLDSADIRNNRLFTVTVTALIALAFWFVLVNPFSYYIPEAFLAISCLALIVISYLNKRELGLSSFGCLAYVVGCLVVGLGLTFGFYNSSAGESVERSMLLGVFEKHQESLSPEQLDMLKTNTNNLSILRTITIKVG
jgi:hypothetical protein